MISLAIGLIGPILLHLLLKLLLKIWVQATNPESKLSLISRIGGALLTVLWGWIFILFTLILLMVMPTWGKALSAVHNDVTRSVSYRFIKPWGDIFFAPSKQKTTIIVNHSSGNEVQSLAEDPRFKSVLMDPEIQNEINSHDFAKLMSNPKMIALTQQIMSDPVALKKVMAVYSSQTKK